MVKIKKDEPEIVKKIISEPIFDVIKKEDGETI